MRVIHNILIECIMPQYYRHSATGGVMSFSGSFKYLILLVFICIATPALAEDTPAAGGTEPQLVVPGGNETSNTGGNQPETAPVEQPQTVGAPPESGAQAAENNAEADELESLEDLGKLEALEELDQAEVIEKEQLKFFEMNGYFRFRADLFHNLDLGIYNRLRPLGDKATGNQDDDNNRTDNTLGSANMRLRLRPTLNISEDIKINITVDALDNLVMGSTPDTYNGLSDTVTAAGIGGFSNAQIPPSAGSNSLRDSIVVKHAWGEVRTPFGFIKFGRMPDHWGMGMYYNDGMCIDCDYGDTADRILFGTKIFDHMIFVSTEFINEGLTNDNLLYPQGQAKDATQLDDVQQFTFGFARQHNNAEIEELLENDGYSINYGMNNSIRWQYYALEQSVLESTRAGDFSERQALREELVARDLLLYAGDVWFRVMWKKLHIELEGMWLTGSIDNSAESRDEEEDLANAGISDTDLSIDQFGLLFQIDYKFLDDSLFVGAEWGMASGDPYHGDSGNGYDVGFGVDPYFDRQFSDTRYQRTKYSAKKEDRSINNFRFDPDHHVDMILYREILGTVSGATYLKPSLQYNITPAIGARLDLIFSWAMEADSTPSYYHMKYESIEDVKDGLPVKRLTSKWLGAEIDVDVFYRSFDGFGTGLQYGVFFPGSAFGYWDEDYVNSDGEEVPTWFDAPNVAQSVQWRMFIEF